MAVGIIINVLYFTDEKARLREGRKLPSPNPGCSPGQACIVLSRHSPALPGTKPQPQATGHAERDSHFASGFERLAGEAAFFSEPGVWSFQLILALPKG